MSKQQTDFAGKYIEQLKDLLDQIPLTDVAAVLTVMETLRVDGGHLYLAGNGGSAATANHMANDLMLGVAKDGAAGFAVTSLSANIAIITASANDDGYDDIFAAQLRTQGGAGDVLLVITGSGNSPNIVRAAEQARTKGMKVVGLLGMDGGKVTSLCDARVIVPSRHYGHIEDAHMMLDHLMTSYFCELFAGQSASDA